MDKRKLLTGGLAAGALVITLLILFWPAGPAGAQSAEPQATGTQGDPVEPSCLPVETDDLVDMPLEPVELEPTVCETLDGIPDLLGTPLAPMGALLAR